MKKLITLLTALSLSIFWFSCNKKSVDKQLEKAVENEGKWCFIKVPEMTCRNGSSTGIGVRLNTDSDKLLIYLEGGGGCFNSLSCTGNPNSFGKSSFTAVKYTTLQLGIFNKGNENNPFRDWNQVYVPYCTGDVHSGTNESAEVNAAFKDMSMVGYRNMEHVMQIITDHFAANPLGEVFLTGSSAGGYGTLLCANLVAETFAGTKLTVLDDSGPILLTQDAQPDCLDSLWTTIFGTHVPDDFFTYTSAQTDINYYKYIYEYLGNKHPNVRFGLISSLQDLVIREFYGYGKNNCETAEVVGPISGAAYRGGLENLRDSVLVNHPNWNTFYVDSEWHVFNVVNSTLNSLEVDGTRFSVWLDSLRNSEQAWHVYE